MLDVLAKCFPGRLDAWRPQLERMIPSYGGTLSEDVVRASATLARTAETLRISQ
jgi:malate dehydrogenase (quinone)